MQNQLSLLPSHYHAWRWHGSSEPLDLALEEVQLALPATGQVLVRNAVIGLNPVDWKVLSNGLVSWQPGHIPGVDGAGEVVAVGDGVSAKWLGQRVAYHACLQRHGSFAEYIAVSARVLLRLPDVLSFEVAASFPCPALTAWLAIEKIPIVPEQRILISGAGGAVGHYLVQLASTRGFLATTMSNTRHWARLRNLGAHTCIAGPLTNDPEIDGERIFYAAIDTVSADHASRLTNFLRANGHLVCIQGRALQWPSSAFGLCISMHEVALGALYVHGDDVAWQRLTSAGELLLGQIAEGRLQAEAHFVGEFGELASYLDALRNRNFSGKPLIRIR